MVRLILGKGFSVEAKKEGQHAQTPQRNGVLLTIFLRREVEIIILMEDMLKMLKQQLVERNIAHLQLPLLVEVQILRQDNDVIMLQLIVDLLDAFDANTDYVTHYVQLLLTRAELKSIQERLEWERSVVAFV